MRGYVTFVLAFAAIVLFLQLLSLPRGFSLDTPLAAEQLSQDEQNAKFLLLEAVRLGAEDGLRAYALAHPATFRDSEAAEAMQLAAFARLQSLEHLSFRNTDIALSCGPVPASSACVHCRPLSQCASLLHARVAYDTTGIRGVISIGTPDIWAPEVLVLQSVRTDRPMRSLGYIPLTEEQVVFLAGAN